MSIALEQAFLDQHGDFPNHMTPIGKFTYLRTYSRFMDEVGRREVWKETVARASEYNVGLEEMHLNRIGVPVDYKKLDAETKLLFRNQFNLKQALSGRTLWVGGAKNGVADKFPLANFNCSFTNIGDQEEQVESWEDLAELFYLLLVGTGVGLKATPQMAKNLPAIRDDFKLTFDEYHKLPKWLRNDNTELITDEVVYNEELLRYEYVTDESGNVKPSTTALIAVGDSKEGKQ